MLMMQNKSDEEIIRRIANAWLDEGGDTEGFVYCWRYIKDAIEAEEQERKDAGV